MKKKLNRKGMTAIELLLTFTILSFIVVGLFDIVLNYKDKEQKESVRNTIIDYENKLQKAIQDDLIKRHLTSVTIDDNSGENKISATIKIKDDGTIGYNSPDANSPVPLAYDPSGHFLTSKLVIDFSTNTISYGYDENIIDYPVPTFSGENNNLTINKDKTYIETRGSDKSFLVIKISFNHPDFEEDELSFSIVCPIDYPTNDNTGG